MQAVLIILGIICAVYGVLVLNTNSGTLFFAVWFLLGALFLAAAVLTRMRFWDRLPGPVRITAAVTAAALVVLFAAVEIIIAGSFHEKGEPGLDAVIVLGSQVREDGPSAVLKYRLDAALEYLKENEGTVLVLSGGQGANEPWPEAEGMRDYLVSHGADEERLLLEPDSLTTAQNIEFSKKLIDPENDRVGILTNDFHVFRGCAIAKKAGIRNLCGIAAPSTPLYLPNNMLREFFALCKDFLDGKI